MQTVIENLNDAENEILTLLKQLLLAHSELYQWNRNIPGDAIFISTRGDYKYKLSANCQGHKLSGSGLSCEFFVNHSVIARSWQPVCTPNHSL